MGRFYAEAAPELVSQQFMALLDEVCHTGETYYGPETPAELDRGAGTRSSCILTLSARPPATRPGW